MATNIKPKSSEIYLTKTEILDFFRVSNEDFNYFVKNEFFTLQLKIKSKNRT